MPSRTPSATITPSETATITPSATATPLPTITQERADADAQYYQLSRWSLDRAHYAIDLLSSFPNTLSSAQRGADEQGYYNAFYAAALLQGESALRFEDVPALPWLLGKAVNMAKASDPYAATEFGRAFTMLLNGRTVGALELPDWFEQRQTGLKLRLIPQPALQRNLDSLVIEIYGAGSALIWLVEDESGFHTFPLTSDFDFVDPWETNLLQGDLTGDGRDELVVWQSTESERNAFQLPKVFDLSKLPAEELFFSPDEHFKIGLENEHNWAFSESEAGSTTLTFSTTVFPPCPIKIRRSYKYDNGLIRLDQALFTPNPSPGLEGFCELMVDHAVEVWGLPAAVQIMEALLPAWPPATLADGRAPLLDAADEWRFRLGMYYFLLGEEGKAAEYFQRIADEPVVPVSRWITPARQFLESYRQRTDIYRACLPVKYCIPRLALERLFETLPFDPTRQPLTELDDYGVTIRSTGPYDFENDGEPERWFTIQHYPDSRLEFYILAEYNDQWQAMYVDSVDSNFPPLYSYEPWEGGKPVIWLDQANTFKLGRVPGDDMPFIDYQPLVFFYDLYTRSAVEASAQALFTGGNPAQIANNLQDLLRFDLLACISDKEICARYFTLMGLAWQLAGDEGAAIGSYLEAWRQYPQSPYTVLARLRLVRSRQAPTQTPEPTKTPTITRTPTRTPTITPAPTKTPTVTGTPPTATASPTQSETPEKSPTP